MNEKLPFTKKPQQADVLRLMEKLTPNDMERLYFFIIGMLSTRGYKFSDD